MKNEKTIKTFAQLELNCELSNDELLSIVGGAEASAEVRLGDKVLYSRYSGTDIKLGTDEDVLLSEKDILAVVS